MVISIGYGITPVDLSQKTTLLWEFAMLTCSKDFTQTQEEWITWYTGKRDYIEHHLIIK